MKTEKLYFKDTDDTICTSLQSRLEDAKEDDLTTITIIEAIPDNDNRDFVWCSHRCQVVERQDCKKVLCLAYKSKGGRGVCQHRGSFYLHGDEVTFDVATGNIINLDKEYKCDICGDVDDKQSKCTLEANCLNIPLSSESKTNL